MEKKSPYRNLVTGVETKVPLTGGKLATYINFDNAATTPPLEAVIKAINEFAPWYSSIHRGKGYKSRLSSQLYEESRKIIADFVKADPEQHTVIFVKNATEAINKLSYRFSQNNQDWVMLSTDMEHHSNDLPWRKNHQLDYIEVNSSGRLSLADLEAKLANYQGKVKLVTVTGASNVTGYINSIREIAELTHKYGAKFMVDGAQLIPHEPVNMKENRIDYLVFSGHKMYAPFGTGVLIGPEETFSSGEPDYVGGGTVKMVTHGFVSWDEPPYREEAGTPNIMGVIALTEAIKTLKKLGMENISSYERQLADYALDKLRRIDDVELYINTRQDDKRVGIIPFNIKKIPHELTATILANEAGIAVRDGCFCAQPYIQRILRVSDRDLKRHLKNPELSRPGVVRLSFGMYNNTAEIDKFIEKITEIIKNRKSYLKKYNKMVKSLH